MYKLIIAEDDVNQRRGLSNIDFRSLGIELVCACENGERALKAHQELRADIIMTDIVMPQMSGIEFLKAARDISGSTVFIVISGHEDFKYAHQAIELGVIHYVLKPF